MSLLLVAPIAILAWTVLVIAAAGLCRAAARADSTSDQQVTPERADGGHADGVRKRRWRPAAPGI